MPLFFFLFIISEISGKNKKHMLEFYRKKIKNNIPSPWISDIFYLTVVQKKFRDDKIKALFFQKYSRKFSGVLYRHCL